MPQVFANNVATTLDGAVASGDTSITVVDASGFPTVGGGDYFLATIFSVDGSGTETAWEVVKVTGISTNTLTVERGQESTAAAAWDDGDGVSLRLTQGTMAALVQGPASSTDNAVQRFSGTGGNEVQDSGVIIDDDDNLYGHGQKAVSRAADFTLAADDNGRTHECASGAAFTVTVPTNANVAIPVGYSIGAVQADGNAVTFSPQSGVTIQSKGGLTSTNGQWSAATLYKRATDEWVLIGDLA